MEGNVVRYVRLINRGLCGLLPAIIMTSSAEISWAQGPRSEIEMLKRELEELRRRD